MVGKANGMNMISPVSFSGALDVERVRADFPILGQTVRGKLLVFLDSAASAQKPRAVIQAMSHAMETQYANVHRGRHTPVSVGQALAGSADAILVTEESAEETVTERQVGPITVTGDGPLVVREKSHAATPMTLDTALYEMELVGHDFFLFVDESTECPSVVYRRRAYDYGVIQLEVSEG